MWSSHHNSTFVCAGTDAHRFKSDVRALADNDRLRLAPCPTCGAELAVESLLASLAADLGGGCEPVHAAGLVEASEHPADATRRHWRAFVERVDTRPPH